MTFHALHSRRTALVALAALCSTSGAAFAEAGSQVEVRAPLVAHATRDAFAASTVIRGPELEAAGQSSADVLARVPGVVVTRTGAESDTATASIRGADATQLPVYVAGIRVNDDVSGTADLSLVPLWMMDRVEVFRGNSPGNSDQLGIGGAIYFWPRLPKTTRVGGGVHVGSFGSRGGFVAGEVGSERAGALVAMRHDQSDNDYPYLNDDGRRFDRADHVERRKNADFVSNDAWAIGRYRLSRTDSVSTVMNAYDREQGITGLSVTPAEHTRATTRRLLAGVSGRFGCPGAPDTCRVDVMGSLITARLTYEDPFLESPALLTSLLTNAGQRAVVRAAISTDVGPALTLGAAVAESVEAIHVDRLDALPNDGKRSSTHLVADATVSPLAGLRVFALAALDCHTTSGVENRFGVLVARDSGTCGTLQPAARLGASYRLTNDVHLVANAGRYVRMPTLSELYGASATVQGDSGLEPEVGETVDVGVRVTTAGAAGRYAADVFAFGRWAHELIRYRQVSLASVGPYNVASGRFLGTEAALSGEWFDALRFRMTATAMDARDLTEDVVANSTTNDVLPLTPRLVATARLTAFASPGLAVLRQKYVELALTYLHRASSFFDPAGQIVLPEQHFLDVELASTHFDGALNVRFAVRNVIGSYQYDLLGAPLPGRSFHAGLDAWF